MAGKGDSYRPVDKKKWEENWERAFSANTRKRNTQSNAKGLSKGKTKPLPVTSIDVTQWIQKGFKNERSKIGTIGERRGSSRQD